MTHYPDSEATNLAFTSYFCTVSGETIRTNFYIVYFDPNGGSKPRSTALVNDYANYYAINAVPLYYMS